MKRNLAWIVNFFIIMSLLGLALVGIAEADSSRATTLRAQSTTSTGIQINEVMFYPDTGEYEWIELKNAGSTSIDIGGYGLTDEDGNWYKIPHTLPPVPAGAFVVVVFDGLGSGSDDLDFGDNVATLHSPAGLVDIFEDDTDQVALYGANKVYLPILFRNLIMIFSPLFHTISSVDTLSIISFVAWGTEPGEDVSKAAEAGIWSPDWYLRISKGSGFESDDWISPNESLGIFPRKETNYLSDWRLYSVNETSRGTENPVQTISWYFPTGGATIDGDSFFIRWNWEAEAIGFQFQLDDSLDFSSPSVDTILSDPIYAPEPPIADGTYFWRVKILYDGTESPWSAASEINSISFSSSSKPGSKFLLQPSAIFTNTLGLEWQSQQKDTLMLDLDGSPETGLGRWDSSHEDDGDLIVGNGELLRGGLLGEEYCVRASISILASFYGGDLSQDRISFEMYGGGDPEGDLGHGHGAGNLLTVDTLDWALEEAVFQNNGKPAFDQIKTWIDAEQPVVAATPNHMGVIDGYGESSENGETEEWIHFIDPAVGLLWIQYDIVPFNNMWVGPSGPDGAPNVRSDEDVDGDGIPDTVDDSDGDGVCDFDERERFSTADLILDPNDMDSDDDLVTDKADIRGYVFDSDGKYSHRNPDIDGDGKRKEVDPDNDNALDDGSIDGCEDRNYNGIYEPGLGETSNFDPTSEKGCSGIDPGEMVFIPAGKFQMGCDPDHNDGNNCTSDELPLHNVYLDEYYIDKYEVTNSQYKACVTAGTCSQPGSLRSRTRVIYYNDENYANFPVIEVDWDRATDYCIWASKRLPTEAEWEKAARGASDTRAFPWGDQTADCTLANFYDSFGTGTYCVGDTSHVGDYPLGTSPYGVMNMAGNVREWVNDWLDGFYYEVSPYYNPPGPDSGTNKALRGGRWLFDVNSLRVASREGFHLVFGYDSDDIGFRCAADEVP